MADRYWVGASGAAWNVTTSWSATSGGSSGASVPTTTDNAIFDRATTYTVACTGALSIINFTVSAGTVTFTGSGLLTISGNFSISTGTVWSATGIILLNGTGARTITTSGVVIQTQISIAGTGGTFQLQDALTLGSTRTLVIQFGRLDLNNKAVITGFLNADFTNTRGVDYGTTGSITCIGAGGVISNINAAAGWSTTGVQTNNISYSGATASTVVGQAPGEATAVSYNFTTGTYSLTALTVSGNYKNLNFTGFSGTLVAPTGGNIIYGNLTLSSTMTLQASNGIVNFGGTSGTKTITTSGKTIDFPLTFNGAGSTFQLQDALTMGTTRTLTHVNGIIDLNGKTLTVGTSYTTAAGTKNLTFNGGALVCPVAGTTAFNNAAPTGFTTTEGTTLNPDISPFISMDAATAQTFVGGGSAFNCYIVNTAAKTLTISGNNTFKGIINIGIGLSPTFALTGNNSFSVIRQYGSPGSINLLLTAGTTQTFTSSFSLRGLGGSTCSVNTTVAGSKATITKTFSGVGGTILPVVSGVTEVSDYLVVKDIDFTPNTVTTNGSAPYSWYLGANSTNNGNNSGAAFVTYPQVVYLITNTATTSWATPADWNPSNNAIYLVGSGGGGSGGGIFSSTSRVGGSGGGGGGFTAISNYLIGASSTISSIVLGVGGLGGAAIGSGTATSTGGDGTATTIPNPSGGTYSAGGGGGGSSNGSTRVRVAGAAGVGTTNNGGLGGLGASSVATSTGTAGGGGGGAAGPNGTGGAGGIGNSSTTNTSVRGGGGGGNGGGSAGAGGTGNGGNNSQGFGGGLGGTSPTGGFFGGGGGGGSFGLTGDYGIDILKTFGGGGGAGGGGGQTASTQGTGGGGNYGGGAGGGMCSPGGNVTAGGNGGNGLIVITYTPLTATGNFFFMF